MLVYAPPPPLGKRVVLCRIAVISSDQRLNCPQCDNDQISKFDPFTAHSSKVNNNNNLIATNNQDTMVMCLTTTQVQSYE